MYKIDIFRRQYEHWNKFQEWNTNLRNTSLFESMVSEHPEIISIGEVQLSDDGPFREFTFESEEWATWFLLKL